MAGVVVELDLLSDDCEVGAGCNAEIFGTVKVLLVNSSHDTMGYLLVVSFYRFAFWILFVKPLSIFKLGLLTLVFERITNCTLRALGFVLFFFDRFFVSWVELLSAIALLDLSAQSHDVWHVLSVLPYVLTL